MWRMLYLCHQLIHTFQNRKAGYDVWLKDSRWLQVALTRNSETLNWSVHFLTIVNDNFNVYVYFKVFMSFSITTYITNFWCTSLMTHLCMRVHEHLGKNICHSLQFWSCESISILKVILQAHQPFFAVYPVRASTVCNDVGDVLHTQQCYGFSSMTSKWHHCKS